MKWTVKRSLILLQLVGYFIVICTQITAFESGEMNLSLVEGAGRPLASLVEYPWIPQKLKLLVEPTQKQYDEGITAIRIRSGEMQRMLFLMPSAEIKKGVIPDLFWRKQITHNIQMTKDGSMPRNNQLYTMLLLIIIFGSFWMCTVSLYFAVVDTKHKKRRLI
ncbi:hypothetical protein AwErysi_00340 [Erysipelotrichaceae bacterium]|nr:hypothetical protein AwErysi_00340 [Erysipelotrichaceae bacterium]